MNGNERTAACARVVERLDALLDGALAPLEAARDEGHLEACAACACERERAGRVRAAGAAALAPEAELARARAGLAARIGAARAPRRRPALVLLSGGFGRAALGAAAALAAFVGVAALGVGEDGLAASVEAARRIAPALALEGALEGLGLEPR